MKISRYVSISFWINNNNNLFKGVVLIEENGYVMNFEGARTHLTIFFNNYYYVINGVLYYYP